MRLMPESNAEKITFCQTHLTPWADHAEEIGSSPEEIAALADLVQTAREAFNAKQRAEAAAQSATLAMRQAIDAMANAAATVVLKVRAKARQHGDAIYSLAHIPVPGKGSPIAPPGMPHSFETSLDAAIGAVTLTWTCKNPRGAAGTMYHVRRRIGSDGRFEMLGTVGECKFVDYTIPLGAGEILYEVQGIRSTTVGPKATHAVQFGGTPAFAAAQAPARSAA